MLTPHRLRLLTLDPQAHPRGQAHLSSASGLVHAGGQLYIVADDEHHLAQLDANDPVNAPLRLLRLVPGTLPADAALRKRAKPDLEALVHFPAAGTNDAGLLVAWGSGSRPQRDRAFVLDLDAHEAVAHPAREVSTTTLYAPLRDHFGELNLEAGCVMGTRLHLFQRANAGQRLNGHIVFDADAVRAWLLAASQVQPPLPLAIGPLDLGSVDGVPLGITDAAVWPDGGWVFSAVAEDTADAYRDGPCIASVIGCGISVGQVLRCERLAGAPKVEGIAPAGAGRLWLVTDADDPQRPSELLELRWSG
ncbi:hypothetical protein [Ramlibacter sp.]|uniref:DUF6929 family protein n=1 Tax=Ramlibacter sp. TaxID=1917967 RepID=UPI0017ED47E7|nr:hypothetical protein [Ramlibacter sp.]MBA2676760.1 hypothetical protein [Ramlibacter sp.]